MDVQTFFALYAISVPLFLAMDMLWIGVIAKNLYKVQLSGLLGDVVWPVAAIFYLLFVLGLTFFATYPAASRGTWLTALVLGGLFSFFAYATYDLTNLSTIRSWPLQLSLIDMAWGTVLGALVACGALLIRNFFI